MKKSKIIFLLIWLTFVLTLPIYAEENLRSIFTPEERDWLKAHPVITVAPDSNYSPVEFYEDGIFKGLAMDYLHWISQTYDIQFEYVQYNSWTDIMTALKSGKVQLQTGIIKTPERQKYLSFTDPYSDMPSVLMIRKDFKEPLTEKTLFNYRVGVIKDFAVEEYIRTKYAPTALYELENIKIALEALSTGKVDVMVMDIGQATYYVQKMGLTNLMISNDVKIDFAIQLSFATHKDESILAGIMDKALKSIPTDIEQEYANKWLGIGEFTKIDYRLLATIVGILGAVTAMFMLVSLWLFTLRKKDSELANVNRQLEEQIKALGEAQQQLLESEKIHALSRLAIGIAHEINTPLGNGISITSYIQTLAHDLLTHLSQKKADLGSNQSELYDIALQIDKSGGMALTSLKKTAKIIADFQAVANYQHNTEEKEILLSTEIEQIASILACHENMKSTLILKLQPDIYTTMTSNCLLQILSALMENSYLHAYSKQEGPIEISLKAVANMIHLTYKDYGMGIPEQELPNIFEPFYSTKRGTEQRLGLGLYNVFNIVTHILNGQIAAHASLTGGTVFEIRFPIKKNADS